MACIEMFTKYATVVPLKSRQGPDFLSVLMECLSNMGKKPTCIYSNNEGSSNSKDVLGYLEDRNIDIITTRNHAHFVEIYIRTFKAMLRTHIDYDIKTGVDNVQWHKYIFPIRLT